MGLCPSWGDQKAGSIREVPVYGGVCMLYPEIYTPLQSCFLCNMKLVFIAFKVSLGRWSFWKGKTRKQTHISFWWVGIGMKQRCKIHNLYLWWILKWIYLTCKKYGNLQSCKTMHFAIMSFRALCLVYFDIIFLNFFSNLCGSSVFRYTLDLCKFYSVLFTLWLAKSSSYFIY